MDVRALLNANDARLRALYAGEVPATRYESLADAPRCPARANRDFDAPPQARTGVIGNHTDHNLGRVLAAAVDLDTVAAVAPNGTSLVTLWSEGYDKSFVVDLADLSVHEEEKETTYALIRGVAARLKELGYKVGGFDACVTSTVFKGSGLSSSAAFEVMLVAVFDALYNGWTVDAKLRAQISKYAENVFFGKPSGLMDQMASSVGGLVTIDFLPDDPDVRAIQYDFQKKGYAVCVVTVGGDHGDLTSEYAAITTELHEVCEALGVRVLAETNVEALNAALPTLKNHVPDRALLRAFHFFDETARVGEAVAALERDDVRSFLGALVASGESSWKLLQNLYVPGSSNQEMPLALEMSRRMLAGRGAWRIHGGGFAGTILAFVPMDMLDAYRAQMDAVFGDGATVALHPSRGRGGASVRGEETYAPHPQRPPLHHGGRRLHRRRRRAYGRRQGRRHGLEASAPGAKSSTRRRDPGFAFTAHRPLGGRRDDTGDGNEATWKRARSPRSCWRWTPMGLRSSIPALPKPAPAPA